MQYLRVSRVLANTFRHDRRNVLLWWTSGRGRRIYRTDEYAVTLSSHLRSLVLPSALPRRYSHSHSDAEDLDTIPFTESRRVLEEPPSFLRDEYRYSVQSRGQPSADTTVDTDEDPLIDSDNSDLIEEFGLGLDAQEPAFGSLGASEKAIICTTNAPHSVIQSLVPIVLDDLLPRLEQSKCSAMGLLIRDFFGNRKGQENKGGSLNITTNFLHDPSPQLSGYKYRSDHEHIYLIRDIVHTFLPVLTLKDVTVLSRIAALYGYPGMVASIWWAYSDQQEVVKATTPTLRETFAALRGLSALPGLEQPDSSQIVEDVLVAVRLNVRQTYDKAANRWTYATSMMEGDKFRTVQHPLNEFIAAVCRQLQLNSRLDELQSQVLEDELMHLRFILSDEPEHRLLGEQLASKRQEMNQIHSQVRSLDRELLRYRVRISALTRIAKRFKLNNAGSIVKDRPLPNIETKGHASSARSPVASLPVEALDVVASCLSSLLESSKCLQHDLPRLRYLLSLMLDIVALVLSGKGVHSAHSSEFFSDYNIARLLDFVSLKKWSALASMREQREVMREYSKIRAKSRKDSPEGSQPKYRYSVKPQVEFVDLEHILPQVLGVASGAIDSFSLRAATIRTRFENAEQLIAAATMDDETFQLVAQAPKGLSQCLPDINLATLTSKDQSLLASALASPTLDDEIWEAALRQASQIRSEVYRILCLRPILWSQSILASCIRVMSVSQVGTPQICALWNSVVDDDFSLEGPNVPSLPQNAAIRPGLKALNVLIDSLARNRIADNLVLRLLHLLDQLESDDFAQPRATLCLSKLRLMRGYSCPRQIQSVAIRTFRCIYESLADEPASVRDQLLSEATDLMLSILTADNSNAASETKSLTAFFEDCESLVQNNARILGRTTSGLVACMRVGVTLLYRIDRIVQLGQNQSGAQVSNTTLEPILPYPHLVSPLVFAEDDVSTLYRPPADGAKAFAHRYNALKLRVNRYIELCNQILWSQPTKSIPSESVWVYLRAVLRPGGREEMFQRETLPAKYLKARDFLIHAHSTGVISLWSTEYPAESTWPTIGDAGTPSRSISVRLPRDKRATFVWTLATVAKLESDRSISASPSTGVFPQQVHAIFPHRIELLDATDMDSESVEFGSFIACLTAFSAALNGARFDLYAVSTLFSKHFHTVSEKDSLSSLRVLESLRLVKDEVADPSTVIEIHAVVDVEVILTDKKRGSA